MKIKRQSKENVIPTEPARATRNLYNQLWITNEN